MDARTYIHTVKRNTRSQPTFQNCITRKITRPVFLYKICDVKGGKRWARSMKDVWHQLSMDWISDSVMMEASVCEVHSSTSITAGPRTAMRDPTATDVGLWPSTYWAVSSKVTLMYGIVQYKIFQHYALQNKMFLYQHRKDNRQSLYTIFLYSVN